MCGLMVDAYSLRKKTAECEKLLSKILESHPGNDTEFKTSKFMSNKGYWSSLPIDERMQFLRKICEFACERGNQIYGFALSISSLTSDSKQISPPINKTRHWQISAMFIASLVQKKMQKIGNNKGHTVLVIDDNKVEMSHFQEEIHAKNPWFDGLYQVRNNKKSRDWKALKEKDRFDQIINTPFAVKSNHSTLIQVADAICYVYRRYLELRTTQNSSDDLDYYTELFQILENSRVKLGQCPANNQCLKFYRMIKHYEWSL